MKHKRFFMLIASLSLILALSVTAFAANSTTATVPITLTVSNEYRAINVTVPAALPVEVINGVVLTADNAQITNNSKTGAVEVTSVSVTDGAYKVGNYNDFSGSRTIALKINNAVTKGTGVLAIRAEDFPVIEPGGSLKLKYFAKISGDAENAENVQAANVVFTIKIVG